MTTAPASAARPLPDARFTAVALVAALAAVVAAALLIPAQAPTGGRDGLAVHAQSHDAPSQAQAVRPATVVTPLSCTKLPHVPGKSVTTALVHFPPGAYTPRHRHPGSVMAFVLKGTLRSQMAGEAVGTFGAGQTWFEPPGAVHLFAENASATEPTDLLATIIADDDCGPLTIPD